MTLWIVFLVIVVAGLGMAGAFFLRGRREAAARAWQLGRRTVLLKILVPKNNEKTPAAAENLFAALHGIYRPDLAFNEHVSLEIIAANAAIEFFVQCPVDLREFIEGQIYAQYPNVEIHEVTDYARIDLADRRLAAAELTLNKPDLFPIKTFQNFDVDPLAGITGVLSHTGDAEVIWLQTLVRPISDSWQNKALGYAAAVRSGNLRSGGWFQLVMRALIDIFRPPPPADAKPSGGEKKLPANQEAALKALEEKATKLGYATKIRMVVISPDATTATAKVNAISGAYKQFNTLNMNGFKVGKITTDPDYLETYRLRTFPENEGNILNITELASIFHFPNVSVETPNIVWAGAKKGEPPAGLPLEGVVTPTELTLFGLTDFRGVRQRFGIKVKDRQQHMYAIGKSGTGKSTLLENMAIDDIRKGRGVAIVDPHGDFINHILDFIPEERVGDVIYFAPADRDHPVGFNLLENVEPALKNIVASGVVAVFEKIFGEKSWGPRLEYILRNVVLALLEYPESTMLDIMRVLVDKPFRTQVLALVQDPVIRDFFLNEYEKYDPKFRTEAIAPIQNKVGQFLSASTIRNIVGQIKSTFDIEDAMNGRKILLLDLSIGKIGEDTAALLGSMMITKIQLASMRRANIEDPDQRVDFYLYVDEFQNFATDSFAVILSEARKYRLNLILTHQYIAQLPEAVAKAVFGNIGTLISFRVGSSDAVALVKEFEPVFDANDLVNLDNHHIYAKMSIDGVTRPAFSAVTLPPASEPVGLKERIITNSRQLYSRPREEVEARIAEASAVSKMPVTGAIAGIAPGAITRGPATPGAGLPAGPAGETPSLELDGQPVTTSQDRQGRHWYMVQKSETGNRKSDSGSQTSASQAPVVEQETASREPDIRNPASGIWSAEPVTPAQAEKTLENLRTGEPGAPASAVAVAPALPPQRDPPPIGGVASSPDAPVGTLRRSPTQSSSSGVVGPISPPKAGSSEPAPKPDGGIQELSPDETIILRD